MSYEERIIETFERQQDEILSLAKRLDNVEPIIVELNMKISLLLQEIKAIDYTLRKLEGKPE